MALEGVMHKHIVNSFAASGADGRLVALVAEGLPEFPADGDFSGIGDGPLGEMYEAYGAQLDELANDPAGDLDEMDRLSGQMEALGIEAHTRFSDQGGDAGEGGSEGEGEGEGGDAGAGEGEGEGSGEAAPDAGQAAEREERIAAMRARAAGAPAAPAAPSEVAGVTREELAAVARMAAEAGATAGAQAAAAAVAAVAEPLRPVVSGGRATAADLGGYRSDSQAPASGIGNVRPRIDARLLSSADVPGIPMGQPITRFEQLRDAMINRHKALGRSTGVEDESVPVASLVLDSNSVRPERDLRNLDWAQARAKVNDVVGPQALGIDPFTGREAPIGRGGVAAHSLVASGGLSAPVEPYYPQMVIAQGARPVRDALPTFAADRGGIKLVRPPSLSTLSAATTPGKFTDGVPTSGDATFTSATAAFTAADVGSPIVGSAGIPDGTTIASINSGTSVELSVNATATTTGVTFYIRNRNPYNLGPAVGLVTAAQDAAGPPNTLKLTYDVPLGSQAEFDVYSVYTSLQFANLTARTFPEQVEANIRLADALAARTADTQLLDIITLWSTLLTGAKTFGTARQLLAQLGHMAAFYRNSERMDPRAVLRVGVPAWAIDAMRADYLSTFIGGGAANWGLSDDEIAGFFQEHRLLPFLYQDGPTDLSQLFATSAIAAATGNGTTAGTPTPIPDYPGSGATTSFRTKIVSFMWAEGTWLDLTTGELNLGLVRDSVLNSQNRFRNFQEEFEAPAMVGPRSLRCVHTTAADGTYGAAVSITLGVGSGL